MESTAFALQLRTFRGSNHKAYCGSLFIGHRTADNLVSHLFEFIDGIGLKTNLLLALKIEGPNLIKHLTKIYLKS